MKAISIQQPFAHWILVGEKEYEYRTWSTDHRGDLLICSSANPKIEDTIPGHALCIVNVTDVIQVTKKNYLELGLDEAPATGEKLFAWKLEDVRVVNPFPVKGKLNFYYVDDSLIHIHEETEDMSEQEAQAWYDKYFAPYVYHKKEKMSEDEVRRRLAGRAAEYLMFMDDDEE